MSNATPNQSENVSHMKTGKIFDLPLDHQVFDLSSVGYTLKFLLPQPSSLGLPERHLPTSRPLVSEEAIETYIRWRYTAQPWYNGSEEKFTKTCLWEISSIHCMFPRVQNETYVMAIAANTAFVIEFDDLLETQKPIDALQYLRLTQDLFQNWILNPYQTQQPIDTTTTASRLLHLASSLITYLATLIPLPDLIAFITVLRATIVDLELNEHLRLTAMPTMQSYLHSRQLSMVYRPPIFLCQQENTPQPLHTCSHELQSLDQTVGLAIGFQNDLLGLPRDIATRDHNNYAIISARLDGIKQEDIVGVEDVQKYIRRGLETHDSLAARAATLYCTLQQKDEGGQEAKWADSLIVLLQCHAVWLATSKRYEVEL